MDITLLSNLRPGVFNYTICVRISRMWEFHGKNNDEEIKHLDLVVIDEKVNSKLTMIDTVSYYTKINVFFRYSKYHYLLS